VPGPIGEPAQAAARHVLVPIQPLPVAEVVVQETLHKAAVWLTVVGPIGEPVPEVFKQELAQIHLRYAGERVSALPPKVVRLTPGGRLLTGTFPQMEICIAPFPKIKIQSSTKHL
jgi:hypothetical protein